MGNSKIQKLFYISPRDMRKNRADAVHIMYSCAGFSNEGLDVTLITPKVSRENFKVEFKDIFSLYDVPENFKIVELNTKIKEFNNKSSVLSLLVNRFIFNLFYLIQHLSVFRSKDVVVYSKCYTSVIPYILFKFFGIIRCKLVFETPFLQDNRYHKFIMKRMDAIVVMTSYVQEFLINKFKIATNKVIKCPIRFQSDYHQKSEVNKTKIREELNWDENFKYVVYAGKAGKKSTRIQNFVDASNLFDDLKFVIVGATEAIQKAYGDGSNKNLILYPFQTYPQYLNMVYAADILVSTYEDNLYNRYTLSPGKGGAYLQSENPVIFSDLPCLRERFPNELVSFVKPNDLDDLVLKIKEILQQYPKFKVSAQKAADFASQRTFTDASKAIIDKLNTLFFN